MNTLLQISRILRQPVSFFFKEANINLNKKKVRFFRSVGPKSNKLNMALDVRTNWLWEFVQTLLDAGIRLPTPNVPFYDERIEFFYYTRPMWFLMFHRSIRALELHFR